MNAVGWALAALAGLAVLVVGFFTMLTGSLALGAAEAPAPPPELEAAYRQVAQRTDVDWTALAAWDAAEKGFNLGLPTAEEIFTDLVRDELERKRQDAEDWCREHAEETDRCPPDPPELTPQEETALWRRAYATWRQQLVRYVEAHAELLQAHLDELDRDPEAVFNLFLSRSVATRATELMDGYLVLEGLQVDADEILITPTEPPRDWAPVDGFAWPVVAPITSRFGMRLSPIDGVWRLHAGIDLGVDTGTPIRASKAGTVTAAEMNPIYGLMVIVDHGDGYETLYAHSSAPAVRSGQTVEQGQVVAYAGSTGLSTGPHLHFEIHYHEQPVDPLLLLTERSGRD